MGVWDMSPQAIAALNALCGLSNVFFSEENLPIFTALFIYGRSITTGEWNTFIDMLDDSNVTDDPFIKREFWWPANAPTVGAMIVHTDRQTNYILQQKTFIMLELIDIHNRYPHFLKSLTGVPTEEHNNLLKDIHALTAEVRLDYNVRWFTAEQIEEIWPRYLRMINILAKNFVRGQLTPQHPSTTPLFAFIWITQTIFGPKYTCLTIDALLKAGADPNIRNSFSDEGLPRRNTVQSTSAQNQEASYFQWTALQLTCYLNSHTHGRENEIQYLIMKMLINSGADTRLHSPNYDTLFDEICMQTHLKLGRALCKYLIDIECDEKITHQKIFARYDEWQACDWHKQDGPWVAKSGLFHYAFNRMLERLHKKAYDNADPSHENYNQLNYHQTHEIMAVMSVIEQNVKYLEESSKFSPYTKKHPRSAVPSSTLSVPEIFKGGYLLYSKNNSSNNNLSCRM